MPFGMAMSPEEVIDERDEVLHDEIDFKVKSQIRTVSSLTTLGQPCPVVNDIIDSLKCSICMETVTNPQVIKHCLHFFCKPCIEN
jgi:formylmethanofuran dehydrogenase subunit E